MRLSQGLLFAINTYYAFRMKGRSGVFSSEEEKETCCKMVVEAATNQGISCNIVPGVIWLQKDDKTLTVDGPLFPGAALKAVPNIC